ncbi:DAK2 domain-containing protein, partial [Schaalia georgiae]
MEPQASVLAAAMASAAEEARRLAPFLNDLDGWDGSDCDTGSNAAATLAAMASALAALGPGAPFSTAVEACARTAVRQGVGHVGVLLGGVFASWAAVLLDEARPTPLVVRRMLCARPAPGCRIDASPAVVEVLAGARAELVALGDTLPDVADVISLCSSQAQIGLVEATSEQTGRIDAGAAVLALVLACLDSATRADPTILESYAVMLADLAALGGGRAPSPAPPPAGRRFTVDIVMQGEDKDRAALVSRLDALGARLSTVGHTDLFGLGEWRFHVDTSAPLAALPRTGRTLRFQVRDARPDEMIGIDELADEGITHRGVRLLERRPVRRVERATVIACTRAPGLVEELARAGAVVFLDPSPEDAPGLAVAAASSSTGVALIAPCDEACAALVARAASLLPSGPAAAPSVLSAATSDDLGVLAVARACAPL